jgi:hypothetical protein
MNEEIAFQRIIEYALALIGGRCSALQTARDITGIALSERECWKALGGAHGPLSALYGAADESDRQHFLGADVTQWHPSVKDTRREALAKAEEQWHPKVRTACDVLIQYASKL